MDTLQHDVGRWYKIEDVTGQSSRQNSFRNDRALKQFRDTGKPELVTTVKTEPEDDENDKKPKKILKVHQTAYVVPPKRILSALHRRTHFKAAADFGLDVGCMKITTKLFNEEFLAAKAAVDDVRTERIRLRMPLKKERSCGTFTIFETEDSRLNKIRIA